MRVADSLQFGQIAKVEVEVSCVLVANAPAQLNLSDENLVCLTQDTGRTQETHRRDNESEIRPTAKDQREKGSFWSFVRAVGFDLIWSGLVCSASMLQCFNAAGCGIEVAAIEIVYAHYHLEEKLGTSTVLWAVQIEKRSSS